MIYVLKKPIMITLHDSALSYFLTLIKLEFKLNVNLRLFVYKPCTEDACVNLIYCYNGEEVGNDLKIEINNFILFIERDSFYSLKSAVISFENGVLVIKAPNIKGNSNYNNVSFKKKVSIILEKEVNPILSLHGGFVRFVGVVKNHTLLLDFGGSCVGCGLLSVTLEKTIKRIIKRNFPKMKKVLNYSTIYNKVV